MKLRGYLLAALAAAAYGTNPLFAIHLYDNGLNANSVLLFRYLLGLPLLALMLAARGRRLSLSRTEAGPVAVLGIMMAFSSLALFESYNYLNSGVASTLLFVYPVMVALLMMFFFHERFKVTTAVCLTVMAVGLFLLMRGGDGAMLNVFGVVLVMVSSLTYAIYLVMINVSSPIRRMPTLRLLFWTLAFGSLVFVAMIPLGQPLTLPRCGADWLNLGALAVIPTLFSLACTTMAIQIVGSTTTAIFGALEPVTALFLSYFALGQALTPRDLAGAALILAATTLVVVSDRVEPVLLRVRRMFPPLLRH